LLFPAAEDICCAKPHPTDSSAATAAPTHPNPIHPNLLLLPVLSPLPPCHPLSITAQPYLAIDPSCHPDMISLDISASSSHVDPMSTPPSRRYQASIYSTHSYTHPYRHGYRSSRNTSLEQLVPKRRVRFESEALPAIRTPNSKPRMSSNGSENGGVAIERKKSYGIGGAGNIRGCPSGRSVGMGIYD
jgi:hypothetical protein